MSGLFNIISYSISVAWCMLFGVLLTYCKMPLIFLKLTFALWYILNRVLHVCFGYYNDIYFLFV